MTDSAILLEHLAVGPLQVNCFVVGCPQTRQALVIDPGEEGDRILQTAEVTDLQVARVVNTHGHFDHIGANRRIVEATGAELLIHRQDAPLLGQADRHAAMFGLQATPSPEPDRLLEHGDRVRVGELDFEVLHIPGHSPGGIALYGHGHLFAGDILFAGSIGRTDLPGGDHQALITGIRKHLMGLPEETVVHTGHGPDTTIGREKQHNPYVGAAGGGAL